MRDTVVPPPDASFRCEVEPDHDAAHVIAIGELDIATARIVHEHLARLRDVGSRRLVLDLRQVTFMDAGGLNLVLAWRSQVHADGLVAFDVICGPGVVQRLFAMSNTVGLIDVVDASGAPVTRQNGDGSLAAHLDRATATGTPLSRPGVSL